MPAVHRRWTAAQVRDLIDESRPWPRYELIDGELIVTPAPGWNHQVVVTELIVLLSDFANREALGIVLASPADLQLRTGTITQPDVFVVPVGGAEQAGAKPQWSDIRRLSLAVEIISPSSIRIDRVVKREYYLSVGVPDYLVVDIDHRTIEHWTPGSAAPLVLRSELVWHPAGAAQPLVVALPEFFDRIGAQMRLIGLNP
ncbi:MAG: Uma2 family endonuclease [Gemmatimonadaceae bacterium]